MLCLKVYNGPIAIGIFQIFIFSSMWVVICKYTRHENINEQVKVNNHFILQIIVTLILSLIPINAIYSISLMKDVLFSYFLMFLCFLIKVMLDKDFKLDYKFVLIISLTMAFVFHLRAMECT